MKGLYRTVILHIVLYGFDTSFFTLRGKHELKAFQNRILRKIFGPKTVKETEDWRKVHNKKFYDLCCSPNIIRMRWTWNVAYMGRKECIHGFGGEN